MFPQHCHRLSSREWTRGKSVARIPNMHLRKFDVFGAATLPTTRLVSRDLAMVKDASVTGEISVSRIQSIVIGPDRTKHYEKYKDRFETIIIKVLELKRGKSSSRKISCWQSKLYNNSLVILHVLIKKVFPVPYRSYIKDYGVVLK